MSFADIALPGDIEQGTVRIMQLILLGISVYGVVTASPALVLNGAFPLLVTVVPAYLQRDYRVRIDTGLAFLLTLAALVHTVGAAGPYQSVPGYDEIAHSLSASVVAVSGYAAVRSLEIHSTSMDFPKDFLRAFTVIVVIAFGGLWELFELLIGTAATFLKAKPPLVVYGLDDAVLDMVFNTVGGVVVAVVAPWAVSLLPRTLATRFLDR